MKHIITGWVVITINHPTHGGSWIVDSTFKFKRTDSISEFCKGLGSSWRYWKDKYNFRCVKATSTIELNKPQP